MIPMHPKETIRLFDSYLADQGLTLSAVVVGGAALGLLDVVSRQTQDCDILHPELPEKIRHAASSFAAVQRRAGRDLQDDWLNNGPASLTKDLPNGWEERLQTVYSGQAINLQTLSRLDLLRSKLFSLCDRAIDLSDCLALAPTKEELDEIRPWLTERDANPGWPDHVTDVLVDLGRRIGHGI
jgi:hypothetical protein